MEFTLRPISARDIIFINEVRNDCRKWLHDDRKFTLQDTIEWFCLKKPEWLMIDATIPNMVHEGSRLETIGYIRNKIYSKEHIEVGMDLHKDYRGRGWAKKVYTQYLDALFGSTQDYECVSLEVLANNVRAYTLYRRLGFTVITDCQPEEIERGRELIPTLSMAITRKEWNVKYEILS